MDNFTRTLESFVLDHPGLGWKPDIAFEWIIPNLIMVLFGWFLKTLITGYLKNKIQNRQSLMDNAHSFLLNNMICLNFTHFIARMIQETIDLNMIATVAFAQIIETVIHTEICSMMMAAFFNMAVQFAMVTHSETILSLDEGSVSRFVGIGTVFIMFIITFIGQSVGVKTSFFYKLAGQPVANHLNGLFVFRQCLMVIVLSSGLVFRGIIRVKFGSSEVRSNQVLSNKAFMSYVPFHIGINIVKYFHASNYVNDVHFHGGISIFFILVIFWHNGLWKFTLKSLKNWRPSWKILGRIPRQQSPVLIELNTIRVVR